MLGATITGIRDKFIQQYQSLFANVSTTEHSGHIRTHDNKIHIEAEIEVILAMKALLITGVSINEDLSIACRRFFLCILHIKSNYITKDEVLSALQSDSYEEECLLEAIGKVFGGKT